MNPSALVLGLGNPGASYRATRHNLGFWVVERMARLAGAGFRADGELALTAPLALAGRAVLLAKPLTYMNRAGQAAAELSRRYGLRATDLTVVHDDADLELGRVRVRRGGGPGGHNGIRSLIDELGSEDSVRVRLGIRGAGRDAGDLAEYVRWEFEGHERPAAEGRGALGGENMESLLRDGLTANDEALQRYDDRRRSSASVQPALINLRPRQKAIGGHGVINRPGAEA